VAATDIKQQLKRSIYAHYTDGSINSRYLTYVYYRMAAQTCWI